MRLSIKIALFTIIPVISILAIFTGRELYSHKAETSQEKSLENKQIPTKTMVEKYLKDRALSDEKFEHEMALYHESAAFCSKFGNKPAGNDVFQFAHKVLEAIGVTRHPFVAILATEKNNCSGSWHMWINKNILSPWEFLVAHEAAHIALEHFRKQFTQHLSHEDHRRQEKEADLFACKTLYDLGMSDIILGYIDQLQYLVDNNFNMGNAHNHPTFKEILAYITDFAKSKNLLKK